MTEIFGSTYSRAYDTIYQEKDYSAECDTIERIFKKYGNKSINKVLDLGCGTGNHAIPLAERGYEVTGVDISLGMLEAARKKIASRQLQISFTHGDIRQLELDDTFDATLMMFAVIGYQVENDEVIATLRTARRHMKSGGLLLMDFWYGPTVLAQRPGDTVKVIDNDKGKIIRVASGKLDLPRNVCNVKYQLWEIRDDRVFGETYEEHKMRYFFEKEMELFLDIAGFNLEFIGAFPDIGKEPGEEFWNVVVVAVVSEDQS